MLPLRIFTFPLPRKTVIGAAGLAASLTLAGVLFYQAYAPSHARRASVASAGTVYLSPSAQPTPAPAVANAPMLEMHIANNGLTLLRGARVLSVSGTDIRLGITWGSSDFTWKAATEYNTKFLNPKGEKASLADIQPGDIVTVTGMLGGGGQEPVIDAEYVREQ